MATKVEAGDVLLRLDATQIRASLAIVESKLHEALALQARLEAELNEASELVLAGGTRTVTR